MKLQVIVLLMLFFWSTASCDKTDINRDPGTIETPSVSTTGGKSLQEEEIDVFLQSAMGQLNIEGASVAIISDSKVTYHNIFGVKNSTTGARVDKETVFEAASISKPVFALFVLKLVDEGILDLDIPLNQYAPVGSVFNGWYRELESDDRYQQMTTRMVLSHMTGLPNWRWDQPDEKLTIQFTPGSAFSYSGEGYELLADVIAGLLDLNLSELGELVSAKILSPTGMKQASFVYDDELAVRKATGHSGGEPIETDWCCNGREFLASGNLHAEASGYARFIVGLMNKDIINPRLVNEMFSSQVQVPEDDASYLEDGIDAWGLGIGIDETPLGTRLTHGGTNSGFKSGFSFYPEQGVGYVFFTNSDEGGELAGYLDLLITEGI